MSRSVCIHGHFYQPPRENPWLEAIELQDSAHPYHDWNERITAECYAPNSASRILDGKGLISRILNNYSRMSFNFGPTLLSWLESASPETYQAILDADEEGGRRFSGHGPAIAQVYNHLIMPLANGRDRRTQVIWGLRDFRHRFGREPEGMWLPETAVDIESLEILAGNGIRFTILEPHQAARWRKIGARRWRETSTHPLDPTAPCEIRLPSGRSIAVFFYDGPISRAVAFESLLADGEQLVQRLLGAFPDGKSGTGTAPAVAVAAPIVHIATDGETYGHHHRFGEMALSFALDALESRGLARLTVYGEHLEKHPPEREAQIVEQTSWSCAHGVGRWWSDCGCSTGAHPGWSQAWRTPLRDALDWLRDWLAPRWERVAGELLRDPWAARDDYIDVILDRSPSSVAGFLFTHAGRALSDTETVRALGLLEIQRHAMLMYASCGWFFDDPGGIETVQVVMYAGRAVQLSRGLLGEDPEPEFLGKLALARSNDPAHADCAAIYAKQVRPAMVDLRKVAAHYAISSLYETFPDSGAIYCYSVERKDATERDEGRSRLRLGRARIRSTVTGESVMLEYGALYSGDREMRAAVREPAGEEAWSRLVGAATDGLSRGAPEEVLASLEAHFGGATFSLESLFRDGQHRIVRRILETNLAAAEHCIRDVHEGNAPLLRFIAELGMKPPGVLLTAAGFVLGTELRRALEADDPDLGKVSELMDAARREGIDLDGTGGTELALERALDRMMDRLSRDPSQPGLLEKTGELARLIRAFPPGANLWKAQNVYYRLLHDVAPGFRARADRDALAWLALFTALGERLTVRVDPAG